MFTKEFVDQQLELSNNATKRPWHWEALDEETLDLSGPEIEDFVLCARRCSSCVKNNNQCLWPNHQNSVYIEAACNNYPQALKEIDALQAQIDNLTALIANGGDAKTILETNAALEEMVEEQRERIAELEAERRWISVSEPPNEDGVYDTFGYWGEFFYAEYKSGQWSVQGVTHWRSLPKPPESEE